jgi:NAD dependent epimerase/dehydratase
MSTFWTGRRVVVTGGEGFIGSTLVELLLDRGAEVTVLAHYKPYADAGHLAGVLDQVRLVAGDVRDPVQVTDVVRGADTVFHLAALIGIPYSYAAPYTYLQTNVEGTRNVVDASHRAGVRRIVATSTSEVYGTALRVPIDESHPLQPQSPYSASKIGADAIALAHHHSFGAPVAICRPFNTYGPRQSDRAVIPAILRQLLAGASELRLGALDPTRDFTYVTDTARGFLAVAEAEQAVGRALNLGTGLEISIGDLVALLQRAVGSDVPVVADPERRRPAGSEVRRLVSDNALARELTGWAPEVDLVTGLERTTAWLRERAGGRVGYAV